MNFKTLIVGLAIGTTITFQACREDFDFDPVASELRLSTDTISVDTVYNHSKSETYVLKIYNTEDKDLTIPKIKLSRGENSFFRMNVDGQTGAEVENIAIRKKDSLFVFVDIDAKEAPINPFYEDEIIIETTLNRQQVKLLSWIEKATLHAKDTEISSAQWNSSEAHVIDGNFMVTNNLTIDAGTKIYFKRDASLSIAENAQLTVNGTLGNEVKFRSARHDKKYDSIPNQWNKIELKPNSNSTINYAKIIGGKIGIEAKQARLELNNSYVVNHQSYGIFANNAEISGYNVLVNNANLAAFAVENGGKYQFTHSTFANYFNMIGTAGPAYALYLSNYDEASTNALRDTFFRNCIFYSDRNYNAILLDPVNTVGFAYQFDTNLFNNQNTIAINVLTAAGFSNSIVGDPLFINGDYTANKLSVGEDSPALNQGKLSYAQNYPTDYYGNNRTTQPTLGAIQ